MTTKRGDIRDSAVDSEEVTAITDARANRYFNDLERRVHDLKTRVDVNSNRILKSFLNVTTDNDTFTFPTDVKSLEGKGLGFFALENATGKVDFRLIITHRDARFNGYFREGLNVIFTGFGDNGINVDLWYIAKFVPKTVWNADDLVNFSDEFSEMGVYWLRYRYYTDLREIDNAIIARGEFDELFKEFEEELDSDPSAVDFHSVARDDLQDSTYGDDGFFHGDHYH